VEARRIWLNLELAKKHPVCLEYILVHEMVHLLERRHNDRFRELMDRLMPQWRLYRDELNRAPLPTRTGGTDRAAGNRPQPRHSRIRLSFKLPGGLFRKSNSRLMWVVTPGSLAHRGPSLPCQPIWGLTNSTVLRAPVRARSPSSRL
jgi:hypothetical protein